MEAWLYIIFGVVIAGMMIYRSNMSPEAQVKAEDRRKAQARIICQHCQKTGSVTVRHVQQKQGVSGGKATSAILTGGVSLFAVGLSKKGWVNELTCSSCGMTWHAI